MGLGVSEIARNIRHPRFQAGSPPPVKSLFPDTRQQDGAVVVFGRQNGSWTRIATVPKTGKSTDPIDRLGRGTYTYRVCEPDTRKCSNPATVVFD